MQGRSIIAQLVLAAALALGACSDAREPDVSSSGGLLLIIPGFPPGSAVPKEYTCRGKNRSPGLNWSLAPRGTLSFALVLEDPDAPEGTFRHWGAYDIPASVHQLAAGAGDSDELKETSNDFDRSGYGSPCPPKGEQPHHYRFRLMALDVAQISGAPADVQDLLDATEDHVLGTAELTGVYGRR